MKKFAGILVLFILMIGLASAATITVTQPTEIQGEPKFTGTSHPITWTKTGTMPDTVKITLRNEASTAEIAVIADPAPNSGTYQWTIPASIADGKYVVRVKAKGVNVLGDSQAFTIVTEGKITITSPHEGETWEETTSQVITWTKKGSLANTVKIDLLDSNYKVAWSIAAQVPNSGSFPWTVPGDITIGNYKVQVSAKWVTVFTATAGDLKSIKIALKRTLTPVQIKK